MEKEVSRMLGENEKFSGGAFQIERGGWRRFALNSITGGGGFTLAANGKRQIEKLREGRTWEEVAK